MRRSVPVECTRCGAELGKLVEIDGAVYLNGGEWLIRQGKRHCHACGKPFVFTPPKVPFETLLAKAKESSGRLAIG